MTKPAQISNSVVMSKASYIDKLSEVTTPPKKYNNQTDQKWPNHPEWTIGLNVETGLNVQVANVARLTELSKPAQISNSVVMPKTS